VSNIRRLKDPRFNAAAVATWWQDKLYSGQAVIARSEPQACNGFPIRSFPQRIFLHSLLGEKKNKLGVRNESL
jgi:hypothetical protein